MIETISNNQVLYTFSAGGLRFQQGSDHHYALVKAEEFTDLLVAQIDHTADVLILNGDFFDTFNGEAAQMQIGDMLRRVAATYQGPIVFVPGNHCLRGAGAAAWDKFGPLPANVHASLTNPTQPIILPTKAGNMLIGNTFYDFNLLDPAVLGLTTSDILEFYKTRPDGKHLLGGDTSTFEEMAINMAKALTPDIKFLVTHCAPHPSLVTFRIGERTDAVGRLENQLGVPFVCNPEEDAARSRKWNITPEAFRTNWNLKSFMMGSDVLGHCEANPADGLIVIFGHNHRAERNTRRLINGRVIEFCSFQPPMGKASFEWFSAPPLPANARPSIVPNTQLPLDVPKSFEE